MNAPATPSDAGVGATKSFARSRRDGANSPIPGVDYDPTAVAPLLTNYRLLRHVRGRPDAHDRAPIVTERRNFAVAFLGYIADDLPALRQTVLERVESASTPLPLQEWKPLLTEFIAVRIGSGTSSGLSAAQSLDPADHEFTRIITSRLDSPADTQQFDKLMSRFVEMFDVSDSGRASWTEFSDFLSDCAVKGRVLPDSEDIHQYDTLPLIERSTHPIVSVKYSSALERLLLLAHEPTRWATLKASALCSTIELVAPNPESCTWQQRPSVHTLPFTVVSCEVLPHVSNNVVLSCADLGLRITDLRSSAPTPWLRVDARETYSIMQWSSHWERLFAGGSDGTIAVWDVPATLGMMNPLKDLHRDRSHSSTVTHLEVMKTDGAILTASMDPRLVIHEPSRQSIVAEFVGHRSAINSATHAESLNLIASCGFEPEVFVWTPHGQRRSAAQSSSVRPLVTLTDDEMPHKCPIASVHHVPGTPQLLSMDHTGLFKVWDLRTFKCVQSITLDTAGVGTREMPFNGSVYVPDLQCLVAHTALGVRPVTYTERYSNYNRDTAEEVLVSVRHCAASDNILSATATSLQSWELRTAVMAASYPVNVESQGDVTAMGVDAMGRKAVVGHRGGHVSFYSASNGHVCGSRHVSTVDIVDVEGFGSDGIAFAVDDAGCVFITSDAGECMPTLRLEKGASAKFIKANASARVALVFHGSLAVHVYVFRAARYTAPVYQQTVDLCFDNCRAPVQMGADGSLNDASAVEGECVGAAFIHDGTGPTGAVSFIAVDNSSTMSVFAASRVGTSGLTDFECVGRWTTGMDVCSFAFDRSTETVHLCDSAGVLRLVDVSRAIRRAEQEASNMRDVAMQHSSRLDVTALSLDPGACPPLPGLAPVRKTTHGRPLALLPEPDVGLLLSVPGDRQIVVLPLVGGSDPDAPDTYGCLNLDRSAVVFPEDSTDAIREQQSSELALRRQRLDDGEPPPYVLDPICEHPSAALASPASISFMSPKPGTQATVSGGGSTGALQSQLSNQSFTTFLTQHGSSDGVAGSASAGKSHHTMQSDATVAILPPRLARKIRCPTPLSFSHVKPLATSPREPPSPATAQRYTSPRSGRASPIEADADQRNESFVPRRREVTTRRHRRDRRRRIAEATWTAMEAFTEGNESMGPDPLSVAVDQARVSAEAPAAHAEVRWHYLQTAKSPVQRPDALPRLTSPNSRDDAKPSEAAGRSMTNGQSSRPPLASASPLSTKQSLRQHDPVQKTYVPDRMPSRRVRSLMSRGAVTPEPTVVPDLDDVFAARPATSSETPLRRVAPSTPALPCVPQRAPSRRGTESRQGPRGALRAAKEQDAVGIFFD